MKAKSSGYFTFVNKDFLWFCGSVGILSDKTFSQKNRKQKTKNKTNRVIPLGSGSGKRSAVLEVLYNHSITVNPV